MECTVCGKRETITLCPCALVSSSQSFPHVLVLSEGGSYVVLPGSHCMHAEWGCQVESEHPRREPGAAVPSWVSQERVASGTDDISTHGDTALARRRNIVISPRSVSSRSCFPYRESNTPPPISTPDPHFASSSLVDELLQGLGSP